MKRVNLKNINEEFENHGYSQVTIKLDSTIFITIKEVYQLKMLINYCHLKVQVPRLILMGLQIIETNITTFIV